ncbi:hypothetical protein LOZ55_006913, partial [Ophidiomyces ophidiicola]
MRGRPRVVLGRGVLVGLEVERAARGQQGIEGVEQAQRDVVVGADEHVGRPQRTMAQAVAVVQPRQRAGQTGRPVGQRGGSVVAGLEQLLEAVGPRAGG